MGSKNQPIPEDIRQAIANEVAGGKPKAQVAREFQVSPRTVGRICEDVAPSTTEPPKKPTHCYYNDAAFIKDEDESRYTIQLSDIDADNFHNTHELSLTIAEYISSRNLPATNVDALVSMALEKSRAVAKNGQLKELKSSIMFQVAQHFETIGYDDSITPEFIRAALNVDEDGEDTTRYSYDLIHNSGFVMVVRSEADRSPVTVVAQDVPGNERLHAKFQALVEYVDSLGTDNDQDTIEKVFLEIQGFNVVKDRVARLEMVQGLLPGVLRFDAIDGTVTYGRGNTAIVFTGVLVERILRAIDESQFDILSRLTKFIELLARNPKKTMVQELYQFLEAGDIEIDEDGYVIAFKKVNGKLFDIYSNSFDNAPGKTCEVPRSAVNENSNLTCAEGLHVCSFAYLRYYGASEANRVVRVRVSPEDFVSIPDDYYSVGEDGAVKAKARVCKYVVLDEYTTAD